MHLAFKDIVRGNLQKHFSGDGRHNLEKESFEYL